MVCEGMKPVKRPKLNSVETVFFNQAGILSRHVIKSDDEIPSVAQSGDEVACFSRKEFSAVTASVSSPDSSIVIVERENGEGRPNEQLRMVVESIPEMVVGSELALAVVTLGTRFTQSVPSMTFIRQSQDYDEGMYFYTGSIPLRDAINGPIRPATILYNMPLTQVKNGDHVEAVHLFKLVIVRIVLDPNITFAVMLSMRTHHNIGNCLYRLGRNGEALLSYQRALVFAQLFRIGMVYVAAAKNAIAVSIFQDDMSKGSKPMILNGCLEVYQEILGTTSNEVASIFNNIARAQYLSGDCMGALSSFQKCIGIRMQTPGDDSLDVPTTTSNIWQSHYQLGALNLAILWYLEFVEMAEINLGHDKRDIIVLLKIMAEILHGKSKLPQAKALYERALERGQNAFGDKHPHIASILNKLGRLNYENNDLEMALEYYNKGLKVERAVFDSCHPHIMATLMNFAQIRKHRGYFAAALHFYSQLHILQLQTFGPGSLEVAKTLTHMGLMQFQRNEFASSLELYEDALQIQLANATANGNVEIASTINSIGLLVFKQGLHKLAMACFADSLRMKRKFLGPNHREIAILWFNAATVYLEQGEDENAIKLFKEALRIERDLLQNQNQSVILTLQRLGVVYQDRGELNEALDYFTQALDIAKTGQDARNNQLVGKLLNLIGNINLQCGNVEKMMERYAEASRLFRQSFTESDVLIIAGYNFYGISRLYPSCAPVA